MALLGKIRIRPEEERLVTVPGEARRVLCGQRPYWRKQCRKEVFYIHFVIGLEPYKLLQSHLSPEKSKDKTFEELAAVLTKHYTPKPSEVVQSFRFFSRVRQPGETVADFIAELQRTQV